MYNQFIASGEFMETKSMETNWMNNLRCWGGDTRHAKQWFDYLVAQYTSQERKYHSLSHIEFMLDLAAKIRGRVTNWRAFYLAIWFHDVIQNSSKLNEMLSAQKCLEAIEDLNLAHGDREAIDLILATEGHDRARSDDAKLFIDLDLAILGSPRHEYKQYARQCRAEYKLPEFIYRHGRAKVLKRFLQREHIYQTPIFRKTLEENARNNLAWELEAMNKGETA